MTNKRWDHRVGSSTLGERLSIKLMRGVEWFVHRMAPDCMFSWRLYRYDMETEDDAS